MSCLCARVHTPKYLPFQFLLCPSLKIAVPKDSFYLLLHAFIINGLNKHILFLWFPSLSLPTTTSILSSSPMYSNRNWIFQNFLENILYKNLSGIPSITSGPLKDFILPYLFPNLETLISNSTYFSTYLTKNNQSPNTGYSIPEISWIRSIFSILTPFMHISLVFYLFFSKHSF